MRGEAQRRSTDEQELRPKRRVAAPSPGLKGAEKMPEFVANPHTKAETGLVGGAGVRRIMVRNGPVWFGEA